MQQPQIVTKGMSLRAIKADFERLNSSHTKLRARADLARKATNQTEALFALGNDPSGTLPAQVRNGDPLAKYRLLSPDKIRRSHREASMKLGGAALADIATRLTTANGTRPPPTSDAISDMGTRVLEAKAQLSLHKSQMYGASKRQRAKALADQKAIQARHREACAKRNGALAAFADQYDHNQANYHIVFQKFDEDGSGTIDAGEMSRALAHMGLKLPKPTIAMLMRKYDADASGEIDYDEFVRFCQECQLDPAADTLFVDKAVLLEQLQTTPAERHKQRKQTEMYATPHERALSRGATGVGKGNRASAFLSASPTGRQGIKDAIAAAAAETKAKAEVAKLVEAKRAARRRAGGGGDAADSRPGTAPAKLGAETSEPGTMQYAPTWGFADAGADARAPASDGRLGTGTLTAKGSTFDLLVDDEIEDYSSAGRSVPRAVPDDLGPQLKGSEMKAVVTSSGTLIMAGGTGGPRRGLPDPFVSPPGTPMPTLRGHSRGRPRTAM